MISLNIPNGRGNIYTVSGLDSIFTDPYCDCKGFTYTGKCKHIQQALDIIEKEKNGYKESFSKGTDIS